MRNSNRKKCGKCGKKYPATLEYFYKDISKKDGLHSVCKKCRIKYGKKYRQENKEYIRKYCKEHREELRKYSKTYGVKYRQKNKQKISQKNRKYYTKHKDQIKKHNKVYHKKYYQTNGEKLRKLSTKYKKERRKMDLGYKILGNLRRRVNYAVKKQDAKKMKRTRDLLGCTIDFLKKHLESQFYGKMTWDNYGFRGWHIDHIRPCVDFDLTEVDQQKKCFNYKNLQPLWWSDNLSKSSLYRNICIRKVGVKAK